MTLESPGAVSVGSAVAPGRVGGEAGMSGAFRRIAVQTLAMLVDAYRELHQRRLFWITLGLSGLVAVAFAAVGLTEKGIQVFAWEIETPFMNLSVMTSETFYKTLFMGFGVQFWLTWVASVLALVSTASIFPDFLAGGAVDLWMSKPISRFRLFFTKYLFGLLFVALQVGVFSAASFLVLGLRGGVWVPGLFLAIPLVVCFFSYLFAFSVLLGVITRSTIAALLLTCLIWFGLFLVNSAEGTLLGLSTMPVMQVEAMERRLEAQQGRPQPNPDRIRQLEEGIAEARESADNLAWWHAWSLRLKTVLPKTDETIELLERRLIAVADLPAPPDAAGDDSIEGLPFGRREPISQRELKRRIVESRRERSVGWVLGTSLAFEAVVLAIALAIFWRRDY